MTSQPIYSTELIRPPPGHVVSRDVGPSFPMADSVLLETDLLVLHRDSWRCITIVYRNDSSNNTMIKPAISTCHAARPLYGAYHAITDFKNKSIFLQ